MEREVFLETIRDLKESVQASNVLVRSLQSELDRRNHLLEHNQVLIADLRSSISALQKKLDEREKEIFDLRDLNNRHNNRSLYPKKG